MCWLKDHRKHLSQQLRPETFLLLATSTVVAVHEAAMRHPENLAIERSLEQRDALAGVVYEEVLRAPVAGSAVLRGVAFQNHCLLQGFPNVWMLQ